MPCYFNKNSPMEKNIRSDGLATKQLLLEIAVKLFAEKGFERTTSKEICNLAQANMAAVNYHFGSKLGLYQQVLTEAHDRFMTIGFLREVQQNDISVWKKFDLIIEHAALNVLNNDWYIRLFTREIFSPTPHFEEGLKAVISQEIHPKMAITKSIVSELLEVPIEHPAVIRCLFNMITPFITLLAVNKDVIHHLFGGLVCLQSTNHDTETLIKHFKKFAYGGILQIKHEIEMDGK